MRPEGAAADRHGSGSEPPVDTSYARLRSISIVAFAEPGAFDLETGLETGVREHLSSGIFAWAWSGMAKWPPLNMPLNP